MTFFFASLLIFFVIGRKFAPVLSYDHEGWNSASNNLLMGLDEKFDPCGNFYKFSTGSNDSWKKDDVKDSSSLDDFKASLQTINSSSPEHAQWLYNFYTKCMENVYSHDRDLLKDIGEKLTTHFVNQTTTIFSNVSNRKPSFWQLIGRLQRQQDTKFLIEARVEPIEIKCKKLMILFLRPSDPLPDRLYKNLPLYSEDIDFLRIFNQSIITDGETLLNQIKHYLKYSNFSSSKNRTPVLLKLSKLYKFAPKIDWDDYLQALLSEEYFSVWKKDDPFLLLSDQNYFQDFLPEIMNNFSVDLQTYLAYGLLVHEYYDFFMMDKKTNHTVLQVTSKHQESICFDIALDYFSAAFVNLLLRGMEAQHVEDWIYDIEIIAESIFSAFKFLINNLPWLQPTQRILLIKKVGSFSVNIGLPPWIGDDQEVNTRTPRYESSLSLVENDIKAQQSLFYNDILRPLMAKVIGSELSVGSLGDDSLKATSILTPKFSDQVTRLGTKIDIPFGAMVSQLYQDTAPLSMKFSRLGWNIAYQMLEAFGSFNMDDFKDLGSPDLINETLTILERRYSCECGLKNGQRMALRREALEVAVSAFKFMIQTSGQEPPLPKMVRYKGTQVFFISAVQLIFDENRNSNNNDDEGDTFDGSSMNVEDKVNYLISGLKSFEKSFGCSARIVEDHVCSIWL